MEAIRIRHLRSLGDTDYIDIAPITVLLGKNSSGKSTFLKTFLMLKQTFEQRVRGPLLFWGNYVDFGDFKTAITKGKKGRKSIELEFKIKVPFYLLESRARRVSKDDERDSFNIIAKIKVSQRSNKNTDGTNDLYISHISFSFLENIVNIDINSDCKLSSVTVNGTPYTKLVKDVVAEDRGTIFPVFFDVFKDNDGSMERYSLGPAAYFHYEYNFLLPNLVMNKLREVALSLAHNKINPKRIMNIISRISLKRPEDGLHHLVDIGSKIPIWKNKTSMWKKDEKTKIQLQTLWDLIIFEYFFRLRNIAEDYIRGLGRNIKYSAPVRANANRYYRSQNLALDEIDPSGENLPMYISNLAEDEMKKLTEWLKENFDLHISVKKESGHLQVLIGETEDEQFNIADTGFGLSQVIPILVQMWSLTHLESSRGRYGRFYRVGPILYLIEQPELHLHPEMQSRLAMIFSRAEKMARKNKWPLKIICETHSEAMINRFGHEIRQGNTSDKNISIVIFEKDPDTGITKTRTTKYDKNGQLEDWPWGFFDPEMD